MAKPRLALMAGLSLLLLLCSFLSPAYAGGAAAVDDHGHAPAADHSHDVHAGDSHAAGGHGGHHHADPCNSPWGTLLSRGACPLDGKLVGVLLTVIIISQLALTFGLKTLEHRSGETIGHFLQEIYKELAMLGVISLGLILIEFSLQIDHAHLMAFEVAHYLLFSLALCYLFQSTLLITSTRFIRRQLNNREVLADRFGSMTGWGFKQFHDEFIQLHQLPRSFFYDRYLTHKYKSMVIHRLEIPYWCWSLVLIMSLIHVAVKYLQGEFGVTDNVSPFMFVMLGWIIMLVDLKLCSIVQKAHMRVLAQLAEKERKLRKKHGDQEIAPDEGYELFETQRLRMADEWRSMLHEADAAHHGNGFDDDRHLVPFSPAKSLAASSVYDDDAADEDCVVPQIKFQHSQDAVSVVEMIEGPTNGLPRRQSSISANGLRRRTSSKIMRAHSHKKKGHHGPKLRLYVRQADPDAHLKQRPVQGLLKWEERAYLHGMELNNLVRNLYLACFVTTYMSVNWATFPRAEAIILDIVSVLPAYLSVCIFNPTAMVRYLLISSCTAISPEAFAHVLEDYNQVEAALGDVREVFDDAHGSLDKAIDEFMADIEPEVDEEGIVPYKLVKECLDERDVDLHESEWAAFMRYLDPDCVGAVNVKYLRQVLTAELTAHHEDVMRAVEIQKEVAAEGAEGQEAKVGEQNL